MAEVLPALVLVGCGRDKIKTSQPVKASTLYSGALFKARMQAAIQTGQPWLILSAKHGLVDPDHLLAPYDCSMDDLSAAERTALQHNIRAALLGLFDGRLNTISKVIEVHAGADYVKAVRNALEGLGAIITTPLAGKGIGQQLKFYAEQAGQHHAASIPKPAANPLADAVATSAQLLAIALGGVAEPTGPTSVPSVPSCSTPPNLQSTKNETVKSSSMKLTIARSHLAAALAAVRNAAVAKPDTTPILGNVLLDAAGKTLTLTTTDLTVALRTSVAADVATAGSATVRAALLHDLVKSFKADKLTLELTGPQFEVLHVSAGEAQFDLATLPAEEFPPLTNPTDGQTFEALEHEFATLLRRTAFCRSTTTDPSRAMLTGVILRMDGGDTFVAGCDGLRLAVEQGAPTSLKADVILPSRVVAELLRLLGTDPEKPRKLAVIFNAQQAQFNFGEHTLITKLLEGPYPDYTFIIPPLEEPKIVTVNRAALLAAVKRVGLIADGVELRFNAKRLHLASHHTGGEGLGKSVEGLVTKGTVEATARFATELLVAALEAIECDEVNLYPATNKPIAIHDPTSTWLGVIAAMQVDEAA